MKHVLLAIGTVLLLDLPAVAAPHFNNKISGHAYYQDHVVRGKVFNESGEPLAGATIQVKGSNKATTSASDGSFSIDVPAGAKTLVVSYVGTETQEINIDARTAYEIRLVGLSNTMADVVVVGYGTQRKANLTGAVSSVSGKVLTDRPAPNAANLLQGRVSGLQVTQPSAEPGRDNPNFLIRGRGSFGGSNDPLILIDGVTGSFNNLSPDDIESVTVLKDAASASIYGARAANGVILVTTKKGKRGQTSISYRVNVARHIPTALPDFITNSAEYMTMYNAAAIRSGIPASSQYPQAEIDKYKNATDHNLYPNFDYVDYYINPATVTSHNLSLSGGTEKSMFNLSLSYLDQNAMIPGYKFKRYNTLLNYSNQLTKAITVGTLMNLTYKDRKEPPFTGEAMALTIYAAGPTYGPYLPDGSGRVVSKAYTSEGRNRNVSEYYAMGFQNFKEYNLNAQAYMDVKLFNHFTWSSKVAANYVDETYKMYQHPYQAFILQEKNTAGTDYLPFTFGPDILGVTEQYAKTITPTVYSTLTYDTRIAKDHQVTALLGYEQIFYKYQNLRARRINSVAPVLMDITGYAATNESLFFTHPRLPSLPGPSEWAMQSIFGRVNYNYRGKYLLEANIRRDGTSKVSPGYRWGTFPSMSAGWLVSEESFFRNRFDWVTSMKLRGSYGTLGNQDVGTYLYQDNLIINNILYPFGNTTPQQGAVINVFHDQSLRWESTRVLDFGFDLDVKRGLLGVTFDWFRKNTFDILAAQPVPASLGLSSPTLNDGKMRNKGMELELTHRNHIGQVSYGANFMISTAKNKLLYIRVPSKGTTINEIGLPYGSHYLYVWDGIFQVEDINDPKVPKHVLNPNPKPGDLKMKDIDGDGDVDPNDRVVVSGAYPDYLYSFGFNVAYKGFSLNTFFQGVKGLKNRVNNWAIDPFQQGTAPTEKWRNAWTPQNRSNTLPAIYVAGYAGVANYTGSTYYLQDASYLRLKNIVLSYTFSKNIFSKVGAKDLSVYVSADNLITITDYEGGDPERASTTGNFAQYPQAKILNVGLNVKF